VISEWIERQSLPMLLLIIVACLGLVFGAGVLDWWIAHQLNWWVYGLLSVGVVLWKFAWKARPNG